MNDATATVIEPINDGSDFGTFGRFRETPVDQMSEDTRTAYDHTVKLRGVVPGPHRIWLANPKLSQTIVRRAPTSRPNRR